MLHIFDLDHTVINSSHRYRELDNGAVDLPYWFANNTPEKVEQDTLLPLAETMREAFKSGEPVIVITSRSMVDHDFKFLAVNDLPYTEIYHRDGLTDVRSAADLKRDCINQFLKNCNVPAFYTAAKFYDDDASVLKMALEFGIIPVNAITQNQRISA